MRIGLFTEYHAPRLGGMERVVAGLAEALAERGHAVRVFTTTPASPSAQGGRIPVISAAGDEVPAGPRVPVVRLAALRLPWVGVPLDPTLALRMGRALAEGRPDVLHVHATITSAGALAAAWAARRAGIPVVLTLHSLLGRWRGLWRAFDRGTGFRRWPAVVAGVSDRVARDVEATLGVAARTLPNGVDVGWWRAGTEAGTGGGAPRGRRDPAAGVRLVAVQRLKARKRGEALVGIVARARALSGVDLRLTVVGDGPRREAMQARCRALGVPAVFTGTLPLPGVREQLTGADAYVLASRDEAFGLAALEARAAGIPVLGLRVGALETLCAPVDTGFLADDDEGLARQVARLASDPVLRERAREASRRSPPPFDWSDVVPLHEAAYDDATGRRARPGRGGPGRA